MSIIGLLVTLIVIGFLLYLVNAYVPMEARIKNILNIVVLFVVVLWLLSVFGILPGLNSARVPQIR